MAIISAFKTLNPVAILAALIAHFVVGIIWYSIFDKAYKKYRSEEGGPENKYLAAGIVAHVFYTIALAVIVNLANATTVLEGLLIGLMVSIGFIGTMLINELAYMKIPFRLFLLKFGDEVISLCLAGIILAIW